MDRIRLSFRLPVLVTLLLFASVGAAQDLDEIRALAASGAHDLALRLMDERQKGMEAEAWPRWERERIAIYKQGRDWQAIAGRLGTLPEEVGLEFRLWAHTQRASALLELGRGSEARETLRNALWRHGVHPAAGAYLPHWQRLILRSYIVDGLARDAQTAAMRYQQEHGWGTDAADLRLQARILLLNDRAGEAVRLLEPHSADPQIRALHLLARLRSTRAAATDVLAASIKQLRQAADAPQQAIYFWAVAAEAAQAAGDRATAANAMEHLLVGRERLNLPADLVRADADRLWQAYAEHATHLANKAHLLIGDDERWLDYADDIAPRLPVSARSIYAFVLRRAQDPEQRSDAAKAYARLALKREQGEELLHRAFLEAAAFGERRTIPEPIRHALVDIALSRSDLPLASQLMATIDEPPPGSDNFMWHLRRARILVLGGNARQSAAALHEILDSTQSLSAPQRDRYLQVVFDLQSADAHTAAVALFQRVMNMTEDTRIQRELFYWMAESREAQGQYAEAARLYLKSAMHPEPGNMDTWAQTAHYQAAEALREGGFVHDARNLFEKLLKVTDDAGRRAVIKRELQKLWLVQDQTPAAGKKEEL